MSAPGLPLDVKACRISRELKHGRQLFRAQFSPDGRFIAAGGQDRLVHLWDLHAEGEGEAEVEREGEKNSPSPTHSLDGHRTWLSALAFHPDPESGQLFTADYHGVIHSWNYREEAEGKPRWTIPDADRDNVRALVVSADGRYLISAGDDAVVKVWSTADGNPVARLEGHRECVFSLAISPDGEHLVSGDLLGAIRRWKMRGEDAWEQEDELDGSLLHTRKEDFLADVGGVRSLAFSPDGKRLAAGGMKEAKSNAFCPGKPTVLVFDWKTGELKQELGIKGKSDGPFNALQFLGNGILAGHTEILHAESELVFWKLDESEPLHSVKNHSAYDLSLHPDGRQLLAACYRSGGSTGNGARKQFKEKYVPNGSTLRLFSLGASEE